MTGNIQKEVRGHLRLFERGYKHQISSLKEETF